MKYVDTAIVFDEVPDEITLAINISGCKVHCPDCHSKYLWEDIGKELDRDALHELITSNPGITCVCIMGGEEDEAYMKFYWLKTRHPELKTAWYTGQENVKESTLKYLDYVKTGPYKKEFGPLNDPRTNQRFYWISKVNFIDPDTKNITTHYMLVDETHKFWKHYENSSM